MKYAVVLLVGIGLVLACGPTGTLGELLLGTPTFTPTPTATMTPVPTYTPTATATPTPELIALPPTDYFVNALGLWLGESFHFLPWHYIRCGVVELVYEKDSEPGVLYEAMFVYVDNDAGWVVKGARPLVIPTPTRGQEVHDEEYGLHSEDDGT